MDSVGHNNMYMYFGMPCFTDISVVALFLGCYALIDATRLARLDAITIFIFLAIMTLTTMALLLLTAVMTKV